MRSFIYASLALAAVLSVSGPAVAASNQDRSAAIQLCRSEVSQQTGVALADVRLDQVRSRSRSFRVDLDVWRDGRLTNVRCDVVNEAGAQTIASISPALTTATAAN